MTSGATGARLAQLAYGIVVLTMTSTGIARITVFADPGLLASFGLPPTWNGSVGPSESATAPLQDGRRDDAVLADFAVDGRARHSE